MVAADAEALKILKSYPATNKIDVPVEEIGQVKAAGALGIGRLGYRVLEGRPHLRTRQENIRDPAAVW